MALLGNAKPTSEQLAEFRKNAGKGRIWIYQNLEPGHTDWGKLIFLQKPYAPPAQVTDPVDGTTWRYRLVGYILDLKTGEIGACRSTMTPPGPPLTPRKPRRNVIEGPWGKRTIEPPKATTAKPTLAAPPSGEGRTIDLGFLPPDDPVYTFLPPDHPIYSRGPMIFGRPSPTKKTPEKK